MAIGTVKWFNNAKGYGFVCVDGSDDDIFVHYSAIKMSGYKTLKAGQRIEFQLNKGAKGLHALEASPCEEAQEEPAKTTVAIEEKVT